MSTEPHPMITWRDEDAADRAAGVKIHPRVAAIKAALNDVCFCTKCGRRFVTLPAVWPARDQYARQVIDAEQNSRRWEKCNGELSLTGADRDSGESGR